MGMTSYVQKGEVIDYTNSSGSAIAYGDVIPVVTRCMIAGETIANGDTGSAHAQGVWDVPAVNNAAFAIGDALYWDNSAKKATKTSAGNTPLGWATEIKATAGTTARVKLEV